MSVKSIVLLRPAVLALLSFGVLALASETILADHPPCSAQASQLAGSVVTQSQCECQDTGVCPCVESGGVCECAPKLVTVQSGPGVIQLRRGRDVTFRDAVKRAISESDISTLRKLRIKIALSLNRDARDAVEEYLIEEVNATGQYSISSAEAKIDLDQLEGLLKLIVEYLPAIIEIIEKFFVSAGDASGVNGLAFEVPVQADYCLAA